MIQEIQGFSQMKARRQEVMEKLYNLQLLLEPQCIPPELDPG